MLKQGINIKTMCANYMLEFELVKIETVIKK